MSKFLIAVLVLAIAAGGGYWYWTTTPTYSLYQVRDAFKNHDVVAFNKYVDVDAVSGDIVDVVLEKPAGVLTGTGALGSLLTFGVVSFLKPQIVKSIKRQLNEMVMQGGVKSSANADSETTIKLVGDDDSEPEPSPTRKISLKNFVHNLGFRGKVFHGIAYVHADGKVSETGINLFNEKYNRDFVLQLRMLDMGGYWQITHLSNLMEFVTSIYKLETQGEKSGRMPALQGGNRA